MPFNFQHQRPTQKGTNENQESQNADAGESRGKGRCLDDFRGDQYLQAEDEKPADAGFEGFVVIDFRRRDEEAADRHIDVVQIVRPAPRLPGATTIVAKYHLGGPILAFARQETATSQDQNALAVSARRASAARAFSSGLSDRYTSGCLVMP